MSTAKVWRFRGLGFRGLGFRVGIMENKMETTIVYWGHVGDFFWFRGFSLLVVSAGMGARKEGNRYGKCNISYYPGSGVVGSAMGCTGGETRTALASIPPLPTAHK